MLLDLHYPIDLKSKANLVLNAFAQGYETRKIIGPTKLDRTSIHVFWGLANNNAEKIKQCIKQRIPYIFTDMPYWKRWTKHDLAWSKQHAHWRVVPNSIHVTWSEKFNNNRCQELGVELNSYSKNGDTILICPSSLTLTKHLTGLSDQQWADQVAEQCSKMYPGKLIRIRYKPRAKGTSGPDVENISVATDIKNCYATVTLASIVGVEASIAGVPNIITHKNVNPASPISTLLGKEIQYNERADWVNTLANHQYSLTEISQGKIGHIIEKCSTLI